MLWQQSELWTIVWKDQVIFLIFPFIVKWVNAEISWWICIWQHNTEPYKIRPITWISLLCFWHHFSEQWSFKLHIFLCLSLQSFFLCGLSAVMNLTPASYTGPSSGQLWLKPLSGCGPFGKQIRTEWDQTKQVELLSQSSIQHEHSHMIIINCASKFFDLQS